MSAVNITRRTIILILNLLNYNFQKTAFFDNAVFSCEVIQLFRFSAKKSLLHLIPVHELLLVLLDIVILCGSFFFLSVLSAHDSNSQISQLAAGVSVPLHFVLLGCCIFVAMILFRTYASLWRYAASREYLHLLLAGGTGYIFYLLLAWSVFQAFPPAFFMLFSTLFAVVLMLSARLCYRRFRETYNNRSAQNRLPTIIIGAGKAGVLILEELQRNSSSPYRPVCLLDDDPAKIGKQIHGVPIEGPIERLGDALSRYRSHDVFVALPSAVEERTREVLRICTSLKCKVRVLPNILQLIDRDTTKPLLQHVREVRLEDLLGRDSVSFENDSAYDFLSDKVVLVTGGGGSIGSELCRQIAQHNPRKLIVVDIYENNAYDIQQELRYEYGEALNLSVEIASVRDEHKIECLFEKYRPQIIFHAAAHKHVPLMENCPEEAIRNNVFGTYIVAKTADMYHAERFILISTDKAVNPTNVMGASKRLCEMVVQGVGSSSQTKYAAVRFGNVLGSNGSVVPLFRRQIAHGGPVTITDKRVIRYFMTIPEAAQLVLQAGSMANDSEIFVLDMGAPVSILELAENLIRLSGFTPYVDIQIQEVGLRPGEKLYEELLMRSENLTSTENHKIFIEQQHNPFTLPQLKATLETLEEALKTDSVEQIVATMKQVVPTYKSPEDVNSKAVADLNYSAATQTPAAIN